MKNGPGPNSRFGAERLPLLPVKQGGAVMNGSDLISQPTGPFNGADYVQIFARFNLMVLIYFKSNDDGNKRGEQASGCRIGPPRLFVRARFRWCHE
jgi:hypothetical protein